jgi:predicted Zn finger-like uncharacterized protein
MLIVCPNCATSYQVDASSIGASGRSVRCSRCRTVWVAAPPADVPALHMSEPVAETASEAVDAFRTELGAATPGPPPKPPTNEPPPPALEEPLEGKAETPSPADLTGSKTPDRTDDRPAAPETDVAAGASSEPPAMALAEIPIPVEDAPPLVPLAGDGASALADAAAVPEDIESVAIRRRAPGQARRRRDGRRLRMPALILVLVALCAALLGWRKDIVRHVPQLASLYASIGLPVNLRGLAFIDLKVASETHDGVPVLVVEGVIASTVSTPVEVPRLRFALRNAAGAEVYAWTALPSQSILPPFQTLPFRGRLASPPRDAHDVQVRFFTHRDAVAGLH